jgi:chromosome segregation ATPase
MSNISDHKLTRMKKDDIIALFRETEQKLLGTCMLEEAVKELEWKVADEEGKNKKHVVEIEELNDRIDDHMVQEDMNVKTINELNESNNKLMEKIKFYQVQKENNKNKENKVADYLNNGLIEKIELLEKEKEELIEECKEKNVKNEALEEEVQKWKEQVEENYKHHYDQFEPVLLENEKLTAENKRFRSKMIGFQNLLHILVMNFNQS